MEYGYHVEPITAFDRALANVSLKSYLRVSAHASGERSDIEKGITEDMYYKYFYATSVDAEVYAKDIINRINSDNVRNIVLSGYKGCGKTTFIHHLARILKVRKILLNFDDIVVCRSEIKTILAGYVYKQIVSDIVDRNCRIAEMFDEIFNTDPNLTTLSRHFDIYNSFLMLFRKIKHAKDIVRDQKNPRWAETYLNKDLKEDLTTRDICTLMIIMVMWDTAKRYAFRLEEKCCIIFDNLDTIYNTTTLPEFVNQIALFRNNVDRIFEKMTFRGAKLCDPTQDYYCIFVMRETTKAEFIDHFHDQKVSMYIPKQNMSHLYDICAILRKKREYLELVNRKEGFSQNEKLQTIFKQISLLESLLDDQYLRSDLLNLFNHDYRTCFEVLSEINFTDKYFYQACNDLKNLLHGNSWNRYGVRCLLLRKIFNLYKESGYFDTLGKSEYSITHSGNIYQVNLDRLILLFLNNSQNIYSSDVLRENEFVEVSVLFKAFFKFCNDDIAVVNAIWDMYEMRKVTHWNHLVTFDEMRDVTETELHKQMVYTKNDENYPYGKIRITTAGRAYLDLILPQFEYYASRVYGESKPSLFALKGENLLNPEIFLSYSQSVRAEMANSCKRLFHFFEIVFDTIPEYSGDNFLLSKLAWRKLNGNRVISMYHCERVIHSNIGYLDAFRKYALYRIDTFFEDINALVYSDFTHIFKEARKINCEQIMIHELFLNTDIERFTVSPESTSSQVKIDCQLSSGRMLQAPIDCSALKDLTKAVINRVIISEIRQFIKMLGLSDIRSQVTRHSESTDFLVACYNRCINLISRKRYFDFVTSVDRRTGEMLFKKDN